MSLGGQEENVSSKENPPPPPRWLHKWKVPNKTIQAPTSRDCYFYKLIFFKNFDYRYYLLTIYTSQQQFYLH